ncbi:hypothetical protein CPB85DRAFT_78183 [Mucidula mucida]|nr:hypothetical protein CPB85DRAFT_78183 [Mucidula mucida]
MSQYCLCLRCLGLVWRSMILPLSRSRGTKRFARASVQHTGGRVLDHTGVVGWPLTTMSWEPRVLELVFLPRLVPHLYPGVHPRRAKARRAKRGDSPYARMSPCARKSSLSQVLDVDALTAEQDKRCTAYRPCPRAQSLDEFSGFEIISLCSPHFEEQESDYLDEEDLSSFRTLSFEVTIQVHLYLTA